MPLDIAKMREDGHTDQEINDFLAPGMTRALADGWTQDEINKHLGIVPPPPLNEAPIRAGIVAGLRASPKPVTGFVDALEAGWGISVTGLQGIPGLTKGGLPDKQLAADAPWTSRIASAAATMAGDVPAMVVGFGLGAGSLAPTGPAAAIVGMGGAFAFPAVMRATLMDAYEKGQFASWEDAWPRLSAIFMDTVKGFGIGVATGAAGAGARALLPVTTPPAVATATAMTAEIATMVTVGAALEGHIPRATDFTDAAILLGGFKFAMVGAARLRKLYSETGRPPSAVVEDARTDVTIVQDLMGGDAVPRSYWGPVEGVAARGEARAAAGQGGPARDVGSSWEMRREERADLQRRRQEESGDLWRLTPEELDARIARAEASDKNALVDAFGEAGAQRIAQLDRTRSSNDKQRADAAKVEWEAWEEKWTPQQRHAVYGEGDTAPSVETLRTVREGAQVWVASNPNSQIIQEMAFALQISAERVRAVAEGQGTAAEQSQFLTFSNGWRELQSRGITEEQIPKLLVRTQVARGMEPADAADIVGDFVAGLRSERPQLEPLHGGPPAALESGSPNPAGPGTGIARVEPPAGGGGAPPEPPRAGPPAAPEPGGEGPRAPVRTIEEANRIVDAHISVGEQPTQREWTFNRLYTMVLDKLHPIETVTREAAYELGVSYRDVPTSENPYRLARLMAGVGGRADGFLRFGTRDFRTNEINGPSFQSVLDPVRDSLADFRRFVTNLRAMELENRGIATGFDMDAARQVVAFNLNRPGFKDALRGLLDYQDRTAQYLRDSGVLSKAGYDAMVEANRLYVPFQRVMDEGSAIGIRAGGNTLQASNPIRTIEGSMRQVIDPLESIIRNTYLLTQMAERNNVGTKLVDMLKRVNETEAREAATRDSPAEAAEVIAELRRKGVTNPEALEDMISGTARPVRNDEIRIFRDGKAETWQVTRDLAEAFKGLDVESVNLVLRLVAGPARALRAGATLTPDFMARNLMRDYVSAFVNMGRGVFTPLDTARGLMGRLREDADYQNWIANGGASSSWAALDRNYLQTNLETLTQQTGLMTRSWNVIRHPVDALRAVSELSEAATRLGVFKKDIAQIRLEHPDWTERQLGEASAFVSREATLDFARIGSKMRAMNMITAFFNASIQGVDRNIRAFADAPGGTAIRVAAGITMPSVLLWWVNHDQDWYKETPQWEKDLFWHFSTGQVTNERLSGEGPEFRPAHVWRIPKPFELGVLFGSGPERILSAYYDQNPRALKNFSDTMVQALTPSFAPTILLPLAEQFANRSTLTRRTLIPAPLEKQLPEYQYTPYTTETSKALGKLMGAFPGLRDASLDPGFGGSIARPLSSPILMENYLRAWTGGLGMYALQLADLGLRKADVVDDPAKPTPTLADIPVVRAFVSRYPSASAQSIQDFHDDFNKNSVYFNTFMARVKQGDQAAADRVYAAGGEMQFVRLDGINKTLSGMAQLVQMINRNPEYTPDEKRQLIDTQYFRMIEVARFGNTIHDQFARSLGLTTARTPPLMTPGPQPALQE